MQPGTWLLDDRRASIIAIALVAAIFIAAFALLANGKDAYYRLVQEDQALEWSTAWAFASAALAYFLSAAQSRRQARPLWPACLLGLFCAWVALEELSWGQRLFGYQSPQYFLEHNTQQEFNLHNLLDGRSRKAGLWLVLLGFGVALPLLSLHAASCALFQRFALPVAPPALAPAFLLTFLVYEAYILDHTNEWVELAIGLLFLAAGLDAYTRLTKSRTSGGPLRYPATGLMVTATLVIALGAASAGLSATRWNDAPEHLLAADVELRAIAGDVAAAGLGERCGVHARLYAYVQRGEIRFDVKSEFRQLATRGLPEGRARFFLDPWNSPYWIRDVCAQGARQRQVLIYSLGPNRRRDSRALRIHADDLGQFVTVESARP